MTDSLATWLYAVMAAPEDGAPPQGLTGVADEPVRLVEKAGLAAVVGSVPLEEFDEEALRGHLEDLEWLERTARAHHRVINGAARQGQVIPLRFATLYHDDDRVRAMLQERREDFTATLRRVAGRTEWGVKAYVDPRSFLPDPDEPMRRRGQPRHRLSAAPHGPSGRTRRPRICGRPSARRRSMPPSPRWRWRRPPIHRRTPRWPRTRDGWC